MDILVVTGASGVGKTMPRLAPRISLRWLRPIASVAEYKQFSLIASAASANAVSWRLASSPSWRPARWRLGRPISVDRQTLSHCQLSIHPDSTWARRPTASPTSSVSFSQPRLTNVAPKNQSNDCAFLATRFYLTRLLLDVTHPCEVGHLEIQIVPCDLLGPRREEIFALCERAYRFPTGCVVDLRHGAIFVRSARVGAMARAAFYPCGRRPNRDTR